LLWLKLHVIDVADLELLRIQLMMAQVMNDLAQAGEPEALRAQGLLDGVAQKLVRIVTQKRLL